MALHRPPAKTTHRVPTALLHVLLNTCAVIVGEGARLAISLDALHLQVSPVVVGALGSLFSLIPALSSVATGRWVDRIGARGPMLHSAWLMAASALVAFFWRDLAALFVVSVLIGAFENVFIVATLQVLGRDTAPGARVRNFSMLTTANSLGMFISPLLVGTGIDNLGYPLTFLMLGAISLVPVLVIVIRRMAGKSRSGNDSAKRNVAAAGAHGRRDAQAAIEMRDFGEQPVKDGNAKPRKSNAFDLLRVPALRWLYGIAFATSSSILLFMFLVPLHGVERGMSASRIGLLLGAYSFSMAIVRVFAPSLTRRVPPWRAILVALSASGVLLLAMPLVNNFWILLAIAIFLGMSLGMSGPIILALLSETAPADRVGEALGLRMTLVNVILTGVPLVAGSLGALIGIAPVFWVISALLIGSCIAARRQWNVKGHARQNATGRKET